jgi:hypothetical protein
MWKDGLEKLIFSVLFEHFPFEPRSSAFASQGTWALTFIQIDLNGQVSAETIILLF